MTVVGTALIDNTGLNHKQELCVHKKAPLVADEAMIYIIKVNTFCSSVHYPHLPTNKFLRFFLILKIPVVAWNVVVTM